MKKLLLTISIFFICFSFAHSQNAGYSNAYVVQRSEWAIFAKCDFSHSTYPGKFDTDIHYTIYNYCNQDINISLTLTFPDGETSRISRNIDANDDVTGQFYTTGKAYKIYPSNIGVNNITIKKY